MTSLARVSRRKSKLNREINDALIHVNSKVFKDLLRTCSSINDVPLEIEVFLLNDPDEVDMFPILEYLLLSDYYLRPDIFRGFIDRNPNMPYELMSLFKSHGYG